MNNLSISDRCRVVIAWLLVKCGRLNYDDFSQSELNTLLEDYFPKAVDVNIPIGNATLYCEQGTVKLLKHSQRVALIIPQEFKIDVLANPVYRAHIVTYLSAKPHFDKPLSSIRFEDVRLDNIEWVDDEYSLVKDTSAILEQLSVVSLSNTITSPFKRILNTVTAGLSQSSLDYVQSFSKTSKQRILTNHKPAIEHAILAQIAKHDLSIALDNSVWRQYLFSQIGTRITVEDDQLRFWVS